MTLCRTIARNRAMGLVPLFLFFSLYSGCERDTLADGVTGATEPEAITCESCHASNQYSDMPFSIDSELSLGEGAHLSHLEATVYGNPVSCSECHIIPPDLEHVDPLPAEIVFGDLARTDGAEPVWDREEGTCSGVYCHGATLSAGSNTSPKWTVVDGSQIVCGSCHGFPPEDGHTAMTACGECHEDVYEEGEFANPGLHIDGIVQFDD